MSWPVVGRWTADLLREELARAHRAREAAEARADRLTGELQALKREGFVAPPAPLDLPAEPDLPPAVADALDGLGLTTAEYAREAARLRPLIDAHEPTSAVLRAIYEG